MTRVSSASVAVEGETVAAIETGLLVLAGIGRDDGPEQVERMAAKLRRLRIFDGPDGRPGEPLGDRQVLCISQFTLYADTSKGNRPGYSAAAPPEDAEPLYEQLCEKLKAERGRFGARMSVRSVNEGPMTLLIEV